MTHKHLSYPHFTEKTASLSLPFFQFDQLLLHRKKSLAVKSRFKWLGADGFNYIRSRRLKFLINRIWISSCKAGSHL